LRQRIGYAPSKGRKGNMDPEKAKQSRTARGTNTVSESHSRLNDDYEILTYSENRITKTGWLVVAELRPKKLTPGRPRFLFRWHEEANHLNVDPIGVSKAQAKKFINGKAGYGGHLAAMVSSNSRTAHATILWDGDMLFEGYITIPLKFEVSAMARIGVHVGASVELLRPCSICSKKFKVQENETVCPDCRA